VLSLASSSFRLVAVRAELLRDVAVEAAKKLRLQVPLVVNSLLEIYTAVKRQALFDLRAFSLLMLCAFAKPFKHLADSVLLLP
jgi:hypothetical protein